MTDGYVRRPYGLKLGDKTRRLLAAGLRSLAADLELDLPETLSAAELAYPEANVLRRPDGYQERCK